MISVFYVISKEISEHLLDADTFHYLDTECSF